MEGLGSLDCGHKHLGIWRECAQCRRTFCHGCFRQTIARSSFPKLQRTPLLFLSRSVWVSRCRDCQPHPCTCTLEEVRARGRANGYWGTEDLWKNTVQADGSWCHGCCEQAWLQKAPLWVPCSTGAADGHVAIWRTHLTDWAHESAATFTWPDPVRACAACRHDWDRTVHSSMLHVGDHRHCHNTAAGCCNASFTLLATVALERLLNGRDATAQLTCVLVPKGRFGQVATDFSRPETLAQLVAPGFFEAESETHFHGVARRDLETWAFLFREVVLLRSELREFPRLTWTYTLCRARFAGIMQHVSEHATHSFYLRLDAEDWVRAQLAPTLAEGLQRHPGTHHELDRPA